MSRWDTDLTLLELASKWLDDIESTIDPETKDLYRLHVHTHLAPHFNDSPHEIRTAAIASYGRQRLRVVKRSTVQKERSTLSGLLAWCEEQAFLLVPPEWPKLPKRALGTPHKQRRRGTPTEVSPEECRAIIAQLPQWSRPRGEVQSYPIRARFALMYQTALRPATLDGLSAPEHYHRGSAVLKITDDIDKARFGRELDLTDEARAALDGCIRGSGLIFGDHDYRYQLTKAAKVVLPAARAATFTAYDLRHARLTELAGGGNLLGAAWVGGHRRVTTTALYVKPGRKAGKAALQAAEQAFAASNPQLLVGGKKPIGIRQLCEGEDSNLHGSYPASTSNHPEGALQGDINSLQHEAVALLGAARGREDVPGWRMRRFARAALELSVVGRLALEILDGSPFTDRRAVELATLILEQRALLQREGGQ